MEHCVDREDCAMRPTFLCCASARAQPRFAAGATTHSVTLCELLALQHVYWLNGAHAGSSRADSSHGLVRENTPPGGAMEGTHRRLPASTVANTTPAARKTTEIRREPFIAARSGFAGRPPLITQHTGGRHGHVIVTRGQHPGMSLSRWRSLCRRVFDGHPGAQIVADRYGGELVRLYGGDTEHRDGTEPRHGDEKGSAGSRFYHDLSHVSELLRLCTDKYAHVRMRCTLRGSRLTPRAQLVGDGDSVELAVWFHDAVYDSRATEKGKNEMDSAQLFLNFAAEAREASDGADVPAPVSESGAAKIAGWIEATAAHTTATGLDADGEAFLDFDLSVLAWDRDGACLRRPPRAAGSRGPADYMDYAARIRREYAHVPRDAYCSARASILERMASQPERLYRTPALSELWTEAAVANLEREVALLRSGRIPGEEEAAK